jgi:hypothetical protein
MKANRKNSISVMRTLLALLAISVGIATAEEHSGSWKLNPARSRYNPGPAPKNLIETIELDKNTYKVVGDGADADGKPIHLEFSAKFDGKDSSVRGVPWADMQSARWVDAHTPQLIQKKGGQVMMTVTCRVSKDGKSRTCTLKGKDDQGRNVNNVVVFDRLPN